MVSPLYNQAQAKKKSYNLRMVKSETTESENSFSDSVESFVCESLDSFNQSAYDDDQELERNEPVGNYSKQVKNKIIFPTTD